ncbi:MAG: SGNH/GDSL hydrolase family protein, partial [Muribaculaceae bacterium]|nr:SGNH/GDSL hydrolase family protein [Muribaculaceae bacterium]
MSRHKPFITLLAFILLCVNAITTAAQTAPVNIIILGDSNIWLAGDSCDNHTGWTAWMKDTLQPRSCVSYARSGASWSHTDETKKNTKENISVLGNDNVIYNQVMRLQEDHADSKLPKPDIIIIACGGNDAWFAHKRPHEFSQSVDEAFALPASALLSKSPGEITSLPGAIRYDCLLLKQLFPDARIIFTTSTPMVKVEPEMLGRVCDIIEHSGDRMGITTLRLDKAGLISRDDEKKAHIHTYDGIHTNEKGAEKVGRYVAEKLRKIIGCNHSGKC